MVSGKKKKKKNERSMAFISIMDKILYISSEIDQFQNYIYNNNNNVNIFTK